MTGAGRPEAAPTPLGFRSSDGATAARGLLWQPADAASAARPRGIVQVVHGMSEHIGRYDELARFLASHGFVVCGHDHLGHGKTAPDPALRGVMPARGGADAIVADVGALRSIVSARYARDVPYFLLGHSMGSLVLRCYLPRYGCGLAGAVICGTAMPPRLVSKAGNLLARAVVAWKGPDAKSPLLHRLADGAYSRAIPDARTPFDWLSRDPAVVDAFIADETAGFMFSAGAYATLTELAARANSPAAYRATPHEVPLLFVAGNADPVGDCGRGVARAAESMERAGGEDVTLKLLPAMRHEILNEIGKDEVYDFVLEWINAHNQGRA